MISKIRHRGYDSWGVAFFENQKLRRHVTASSPSNLTTGQFSIGHTRYTTRGSSLNLEEGQPIVQDCVALVHNGQVESPWSHDTTWLTHVFKQALDCDNLSETLKSLHAQVQGSYACVVLVEGLGMLAFRDPRGIRPLVMSATPAFVAFASESCALPSDTIPQDIAPGCGVLVRLDGTVEHVQPEMTLPKAPEICLFEFIYLASDDSVIEGLQVSAVRREMGRLIEPQLLATSVDIVVPVPHTPVLAGKVLAGLLKARYCDLLQISSYKTRREGRTFILPTQSARELAVQCKFSINADEVDTINSNQHILVVDDSIVRGTTLKHVVKLIRQHVNPAKLTVCSLSPPVVSPNKYGIDIPDRERLVAVNGDVATQLGADEVVYQLLDVLEDGLRALSDKPLNFEHSVFV